MPLAPLLTVALLVGPVLAGLAGAAAPAFGLQPALGRAQAGLEPWRDLLATPGVVRAAWLSLSTGLAATALSTLAALTILAALRGGRLFKAVERALSPMLALPHAAAAFGLAFLMAPSGWIARALSPWATGWDAPPDVLLPGDPWGLALVAGLVVKETPFLILMALAALSRVDADGAMTAARSMGRGRVAAFVLAVVPQIWPQLRLPALAVLAYSVSVVDVALILGPSTPPTLAAQVVRWAADPDLTLQFRAAAGAMLLVGVTLAALALWRGLEWSVARVGLVLSLSGARLAQDGVARAVAHGLAGALLGAVTLGITAMATWSVAGLWTWPHALPQGWSGRAWAMAADGLAGAAVETAIIGVAATLVAVTLTIACLEAEHRYGLRPATRALWLLYLPLITPQVSFLFGLQVLAGAAGVADGRLAVVGGHVLFVLPYVYLSFGPAFRAWDARLGVAAQALGAGPDRVLWAVRLPMLLRPALTAAAVGFAVSAGQYLPTLMLGGGRVQTLTTEAVALAAGGDRRLIGVWAVAQTAAPALGFALALAIPRLAHRNRRALRA